MWLAHYMTNQCTHYKITHSSHDTGTNQVICALICTKQARETKEKKTWVSEDERQEQQGVFFQDMNNMLSLCRATQIDA